MALPLDVIILSCTRPEVLKCTLIGLIENLSGANFRFHIHEDIKDIERTFLIDDVFRSLDIVPKKFVRNGHILKETHDKVKSRLPFTRGAATPQGPISGIINLVDESMSEYILLLEDDWELECKFGYGDILRSIQTFTGSVGPLNVLLFFYKNSVNGKEILQAGDMQFRLMRTPLASPGFWRRDYLLSIKGDKKYCNELFSRNFRLLRVTNLFRDFKYGKVGEADGNSVQYLKDIGVYRIHSKEVHVRHLGATWRTFTPKTEEIDLLLELDSTYFNWREGKEMPVRPLSCRLPYNAEYIKTQLEKVKDSKRQFYIKYIRDLWASNYLREEWKDFIATFPPEF